MQKRSDIVIDLRGLPRPQRFNHAMRYLNDPRIYIQRVLVTDFKLRTNQFFTAAPGKFHGMVLAVSCLL